MIMWIVIIVLVVVLVLAYFKKPKATTGDEAKVEAAAKLRNSEVAYDPATIRAARRESVIKAAAASEYHMLVAAAEAHEKLAAAQREQSKKMAAIAASASEIAESAELRNIIEEDDERIPVRRRIITQASFPSPYTNCVGDRGDSLLPL